MATAGIETNTLCPHSRSSSQPFGFHTIQQNLFTDAGPHRLRW